MTDVIKLTKNVYENNSCINTKQKHFYNFLLHTLILCTITSDHNAQKQYRSAAEYRNHAALGWNGHMTPIVLATGFRPVIDIIYCIHNIADEYA